MNDELTEDLRNRLRFDKHGLIPAVVQDIHTDRVLMVGYMNDVALARTLSSGRAWYWSRSRQEYWRKGDTSGHVQHVHSVEVDCDADTVLVRVEQVGPACHSGTRSCFDDGGFLPLTHNPEEIEHA